MKTANGLSYSKMVLFAILIELTLIGIQFLYLNVYAGNEHGEREFTTAYMKSHGFYIFQILGFFFYATLVYMLAGKIQKNVLKKIAALVLTGGIVELLFYLTMSGAYKGAFLYSILDKIIAAAFGVIMFSYTTDQKKSPESYL